jgi:hypothetical protein
MINAILLLLVPGPTWKRLSSADRHPAVVLLLSLTPMLLATCALEVWALSTYGTYVASLGRSQTIPPTVALRYGTTHFVLAFASCFLASMFVANITRGISIRTTFRQIFCTLTYAMCPVLLVQMADSWDFLNTWVVCAMAILVVFMVLYSGVPQMIKPDPAKAFGLYLAASVILGVCIGVTHLFSQLVLNETLFKGGFGLGILGY